VPISKNITVDIFAEKSLTVDVFTPNQKVNFPVAVFLHGFKGFKDWGFFPFMHGVFTSEGIALVTVNFSHNGVNEHHPTDFVDLDAFSQNTISQELVETKSVIEWVIQFASEYGWDPGAITLIGHSRGGGEALVYASNDARINKVVAWAPISDFGLAFKDIGKEKWKTEGQIFVPNARTQQKMPMKYAFWDDLETNHQSLNILEAVPYIEMPMMLLHGEKDESVSVEHSNKIYAQCLHAVLITVPEATHTFNAGHPFSESSKFPIQLQDVLVNTVEFILD